jgi:hypothetical protein
MVTVKDVIDELREYQRCESLTDQAFADKLRMSRQMWNFIKLGTAEPGIESWQRIVRVYPQLGKLITEAYGNRLTGRDGAAVR